MIKRHTRCQGAVIRGDFVLLIRAFHPADGQTYWLLPGGGQEGAETEEETVRRELREETGLDAQVERALFEEEGIPGGMYKRLVTYLCRAEGEPVCGVEPEEEFQAIAQIVETGWFDLRAPEGWGEMVITDRFTYPLLLRIREALGYAAQEEGAG